MMKRLCDWLLAFVLSGLFALLGCWQLQRMQTKQALLAQVPPDHHQAVSLLHAQQSVPSLHWVRDWLHFQPVTVLLDNQWRAGHIGVKVYQLAYSIDRTQAILVDLGWLPLPGNRQLPLITPLDGTIEVQGLWAPPPSPGITLGPALAATAQDHVWLTTYLDSQAIRMHLNLPVSHLSHYILRLDPALPLGYARDLDLLPNTLPPERHLGYAVQWFALALTVLLLATVLHWRSARAWRVANAKER